MDASGSKVLSSMFWKFGERFLAQGISFVVSVVLARLLSPSDYGLVAMVIIFITLADVFVNSGFATALIQKKDSSSTDFSTMFYCSLAASAIIYAILYVAAPFIADFYNEPLLKQILRVFALRIPLSAFNSIQHAYVSRHMQFKKFFFSTSIGTVISGFVGITMAYAGFGVWSLIGQYFTNTIIDTIVLAFSIPWKPQLKFSIESAKSLMNYGSKILFADLIGTFFDQLRGLLIGRCYTAADLAFYNKGQQIPNLISSNIGQSIMAVLFPAMSNNSDDHLRIKQLTKRAAQVTSLVMFPLLMGLVVIARPLVLVLFTEKWLQSVPYVQLLAFSCMISLLAGVSLQTIKAIGRSDVVFKLEIIKKPVYFVLLILGISKGVLAVAVTMVIYNLYGSFVNMIQLKKHINYSIAEQLWDLSPATILSILMVAVIAPMNRIQLNPIIVLLLEIITGAIVYLIACYITKPVAFQYLLGLIIGRKKRDEQA